jgi:hypothetical protein
MCKVQKITVNKIESNREQRASTMKKNDLSCSAISPTDRILFLQRTIGNQAVGRLIESRTLRAKLRIGQPGDIYEQEADRVEDAVMRMSEPKAKSENSIIHLKEEKKKPPETTKKHKLEEGLSKPEEKSSKTVEEKKEECLAPIYTSGDLKSDRIIRIAWTFDDGPQKYTKNMEEIIGKIPGTWFVARHEINKDKNNSLKALRVKQDLGQEIGIHSIHPEGHIPWFQSGRAKEYKKIDDALIDLEDFLNLLRGAGIKVKFVRLPYGLITELVWYLQKLSNEKPQENAKKIIEEGKANGKGVKEVETDFNKMKTKLDNLKLHLWSGGAGKREIGFQSWEAESSGKQELTDNITQHISHKEKRMEECKDKSNKAREKAEVSATEKAEEDAKAKKITKLADKEAYIKEVKTKILESVYNRVYDSCWAPYAATKFESLVKGTTKEKSRSVIILAHDTAEANVLEVGEDIKTMEKIAKEKGIRLEYYTLSGLYCNVRGKRP